jgi:hypothetical protein
MSGMCQSIHGSPSSHDIAGIGTSKAHTYHGDAETRRMPKAFRCRLTQINADQKKIGYREIW